jgi:hypothetical protein
MLMNQRLQSAPSGNGNCWRLAGKSAGIHLQTANVFMANRQAQETKTGAAQPPSAQNAILLTSFRIRTATSWALTPG